MSTDAPRATGRLLGYRLAFARIAPPVFLGFLPAFVLVWALVVAARDHSLAVDFHHELYPELKQVLDGTNPYPSPDADLSDGTNTIWPIAAILPLAPLAPLPPAAADWVMTLLVIAALGGALKAMGVSDWRVYGCVALWPPTLNAIQTANLTLPLCLVAALVWRYRRSGHTAGILLGLALAAKFFLWPLVAWLAAIRRPAAAALAGGLAIASLALILPFTDLLDYLRLVRHLADTFDEQSYTVYGFLAETGVSAGVARVAGLVVGAAVLVLAIARRSFALGVCAALLLSPIVWLHFFALLALPIATSSPTFGWIWLAPLVTWVAPGTYNGAPWQSGIVLGALALVTIECARRESPALTRVPTRALRNSTVPH